MYAARQRPCSFSADGSVDIQYRSNVTLEKTTTTTTADIHSPNLYSSNNNTSPPLSPRQQQHGTPSSSRWIKEKQLLDTTTHRLDTLRQSWPGCEYESQSPYTTYQQPPLSFFLLEQPSQQQQQRQNSSPKIQQSLITLYYRHRYHLLPLIPKSTFFTLLDQPSAEASVSPLLLNIMYAHAALSSPTFSTDADNYARSAKAMLDDYLEEPPQVCTVIALVLLACYESNRHSYTWSPCQTSMYSAMAFQMCYDLKLDSDTDNMTKMIKALKQRVFWCCYCLDKWTSLCTDRPWTLYTNNKHGLHGSIVLHMEGLTMDHDEQIVMEGLVASVQLTQLGEQLLLQQRSSSTIDTTFRADQRLLSFLQKLPASLHWTPLPTPESLSSPTSSLYQPIPSHPPHNAIVGHFHLIFNLLHLTLLVRPLIENIDDKDRISLLLQRCATVATNLTQLGCALTDQTAFILCYRMVAHALMLSVRVHLIQCYNVMEGSDQHRVTKHAQLMFQRSLRSLRILIQQRAIPNVDEFTRSVEKMLTTMSNQRSHHHHHHQGPNYLNGAERSAAEILSNAFNTNPYANNHDNNKRNTTDNSTSPRSTKQQKQTMIDVAALYTSITSNPLYQQQQQIQPHYGYSLPFGKHDEVWVLQEQYQQQVNIFSKIQVIMMMTGTRRNIVLLF
ncbi:fungal-specific transcription factor domain-containing protein [Halteromyces radiatus]|uniref:fungal-specific transcription factor domain-containing protein n=1 Tax=Halteromyces radiatus TaxID=101107 RepID=UPI00221EB82A|nr:fungal-specific transcription factor domain-containing protein [Halteromyces radiatus]KAI8086770.1 fungal-specific transcription factor domain-containing protein [Halteromyces radiatus]